MGVMVCACVSVTAILAPQATEWPKSNSNYIDYADFPEFKSYGVKQERKSPYSNAYLDLSLPLCTRWKHQKLLKGQVVIQSLHSNATYEYCYPVGVRNDRL